MAWPALTFTAPSKGNQDVKPQLPPVRCQNLPYPHWGPQSYTKPGLQNHKYFMLKSKGVMRTDRRLQCNRPASPKPPRAKSRHTQSVFSETNRFGISNQVRWIICDTVQCILSSAHISRNVETFGNCSRNKGQESDDRFPTDCGDSAHSVSRLWNGWNRRGTGQTHVGRTELLLETSKPSLWVI